MQYTVAVIIEKHQNVLLTLSLVLLLYSRLTSEHGIRTSKLERFLPLTCIKIVSIRRPIIMVRLHDMAEMREAVIEREENGCKYTLDDSIAPSFLSSIGDSLIYDFLLFTVVGVGKTRAGSRNEGRRGGGKSKLRRID